MAYVRAVNQNQVEGNDEFKRNSSFACVAARLCVFIIQRREKTTTHRALLGSLVSWLKTSQCCECDGGKDEGGKEAESKEKKFLNFFFRLRVIHQLELKRDFLLLLTKIFSALSLRTICMENVYVFLRCLSSVCFASSPHATCTFLSAKFHSSAEKGEKEETDRFFMNGKETSTLRWCCPNRYNIHFPSFSRLSLCARRKHLCYFFSESKSTGFSFCFMLSHSLRRESTKPRLYICCTFIHPTRRYKPSRLVSDSSINIYERLMGKQKEEKRARTGQKMNK